MKSQLDIILDACKAKGISAEDLCSAIGLKYSSFKSNYNRRRLSQSSAIKIAQYLDLDLMNLMTAPIARELRIKEREQKNND